MKILLVDDTQISLTMAKAFIEHVLENTNIDFANSAESAIAIVQDKQYDVIISDLCMPGQNGDEMAKVIATTENKSKHAKIFLCSSREPERHERKNIELYSKMFLHKPITVDKVKLIFNEFAASE